MKSRDLDVNYLFVLDALERGVVPCDADTETLVAMGLLERAPDGGLALTMGARLKLENLRSSLRAHPFTGTGDTGWATEVVPSR